MIVTVASFKGGVGKTITAVSLAAVLQQKHGPTLLLDEDSTHNAVHWTEHRPEVEGPFPVRVIEGQRSAKVLQTERFAHVVMDTGQKPTDEDLRAMALGCDLLIVPSEPSFLETDGLGQTIRALSAMAAPNYRVLLTKVPHFAGVRARELRKELTDAGVPMFEAEIPRLTAFEKAVGAGRVVYEVDDPQAERAWQAYLAVGKELGL